MFGVNFYIRDASLVRFVAPDSSPTLSAGGKAHSIGGVSVGVVEATGEAPGFLRSHDAKTVSFLKWGIRLKAVNTLPSEAVTINSVSVKFRGRSGYQASSGDRHGHIYLWEKAYGKGPTSQEFEPFPILVPPLGTVYMRVEHFLTVFRKRFLVIKRPVSFRIEEVKEPETYQMIMSDVSMTVETSRGTLKIRI
jgi:hypothetical protein